MVNTKRNILIGAILAASLCLTVGVRNLSASATDIAYESIHTKIVGINNENLDHGNSFVMELSATDYMTATEWSNKNYKWLNCEDVTKEEKNGTSSRYDVDLAENNFCNIPIEYNIDEPYFNLEEYIFFDGVSLAEFSKENPYELFGNKRTRVNTLSIDFGSDVLQSVSRVEIKAGCLLPTLQYSYLNQGDPCYLYVTETVVFNRIHGKWTDFAGYEEGVKYACDDRLLEKTLQENYMGHKSTPLNSFTDFFIKYPIQHATLDHLALASSSDTAQGSLLILQLNFPIDVTQFNKINIRVYTNKPRKICTYNPGDVTTDSLGEPLEEFAINGGDYTQISLSTALYADANNEAKTFIFQFMDEGTNEQFFFIDFFLSNEPLLTKDALIISENDNAYELTFRFNKTGKASEEVKLDYTKVRINGVSFADIKAECDGAAAEWRVVHGVYQIDVRLPKSYEGEGQIKNADYNFTGNSMGVEEGLVFPNGDVLEKTYTNHIFEGEKILDCVLATQFKAVEILSVRYELVEGSGNLHFILEFDQEITSSPYYHACEKETWRENALAQADDNLYDSEITKIFVNGGYKASLLNSIIINGKTIGEWHAHDPRALTNVQIHYGNSSLRAVDVFFERLSPNSYYPLMQAINAGSGITIEVKEGFKFMSNKVTTQTQKFILQNGAFEQVVLTESIAVYFNGVPIKQGEVLALTAPVSEKSLAVEGVNDYQVSVKKNGEYLLYTITYGEGKSFVFQIQGELTSAKPKAGEGCGSSISGISVLGALVLLAAAGMIKGGKKHEEN